MTPARRHMTSRDKSAASFLKAFYAALSRTFHDFAARYLKAAFRAATFRQPHAALAMISR